MKFRKLKSLGVAGLMAAAIAAPATVDARSVAYPVRHQFRQVLLPTGEANQFNVGMWILNPVSGRIRLCLLGSQGEKANTVQCSAWKGAETPGKYTIMNMNLPRHMPSTTKAGLWIINYQTGEARACVVSNLGDPLGTLKCSASQ